jgi:hypothetical protein
MSICGSNYKEPIEFCETCGSNQTKEKLKNEQRMSMYSHLLKILIISFKDKYKQ